MAERNPDNHTGRTVAVVGGGALLLWLLLRGKGWGLGGKSKGDGGSQDPGSAASPLSTSDASPSRCMVRVAMDGITVEGKPVTSEEAVAACRSTERAEVLVTGGASRKDRKDLEAAFQRAGIPIWWTEPKPAVASAPSAPSSSTSGTCALRLDGSGLTADGARIDIPGAVTRCKVSGRAELTFATDGPAQVYVDLNRALAGAGIAVTIKRPSEE